MKNKFRAIGLLIIVFVLIGLFVPTGREINEDATAPKTEDAG